MTKVVLQAIPQFMLSILPEPKGVLQKIRNIQRSFLWSGRAVKQKWVLVAWEKLCKPKLLGGLGLCDSETVNRASGAKLWWRWIKYPTFPWARLWKAKYAEDWNQQELIRMMDAQAGSPI